MYIKWKQKKSPCIILSFIGLAVGRGTFKIIAFIFFVFSAALFTSPGTAGSDENNALVVFGKIDDIAHQRAAILRGVGEDHFLIRFADFNKIDTLYHASKDLIEKYQLAKQLDGLIERENDYVVAKGYVTADEEFAFKLLELTFDTLYNRPWALVFSGKTEEFKQHTLSLFNQLYAIAEQRDKVITILGKEHFLWRVLSYNQNFVEFYQTKDLQKKYELAQIMDNLIYRQDYYFHLKWYIGDKWYITTGDDAIYHQVQEQFSTLQ